MNQSVYAKMLNRFMTVYGEPKTDDVGAFIEEYARALGGYSAQILELATNRLMKSHVYPTWPTLGECVKACNYAAEDIAPRPKSEPDRDFKKVPNPELAKVVHQGALAALDAGNSFPEIRARANKWARNNSVKVSIDLTRPWGEEVVDENGEIVPMKKRNAA